MSESLIKTPGVFGDNGNFLLEREIGSGGMGGVYMGRDKMLDRPVAVKVMLKELGADADFVERFKKEAQAAARLIHPNIVQVYSYGICEGMPYIAMELAAGGSLFSLMSVAPGKTDIQRVLKVCQQTALALQCATDQGVVHGDVKPENILLDSNGNAKLVDFGLAAMQKDTDEIWGTPYYIAPEKVKKDTVDFRADMYSLGATLYHALTGVAPFEGDDSVAVVKKRFEGAPRKPSEIRPEITPAIDNLVMKMIALDKDNRYPSFEALLRAFTDVLTTGLTQKADRPEGTARPSKVAGARMTAVRGRRVMMKKSGATVVKKLERPHPEDPDLPKEDDEESEEGGNLGKKVLLFVIGGILAIGLVVGGLFWFISANALAREAEIHAQIVNKIGEARKSIQATRDLTLKFDDEFRGFAQKATDECTHFTEELRKLLPAFADSMKPPASAELLKAIALTNVAQQVVSNAAPTATAQTNATAAAASAVAAPAPRKRLTIQEEAAKYGLQPPPEDFDPASPEGEEFLAKLKEARAKAAKATAKPAPAKKEAAAAQTTQDAGDKPKDDAPPLAIKDICELWERAYSCQASQIKISLQVKKILAECDKMSAINDETEEGARSLGDLSLTVKDLYDQLTSSSDVVNVKKGIAFIKSKGEKTLKQTVRELTIKRAEAQRAAKAAEQHRLEEERKKRLAEEKAALIEQETSAISSKFDAIAAQGCFRQLDWKSAKRQLENASAEFKTAEGQLALQLQLKKVEQMKMIQDLFINKLKGYTFKGKLKGMTVVNVNEKEIQLHRNDKKMKKSVKIAWQKFYRDFPGNFNEILNHFVVAGRKNANLNLRDWADAMSGAALTMRLVCAEVEGAIAKSEQLVKDVAKQFPEYQKTLKDIFPDITIEESTEE